MDMAFPSEVSTLSTAGISHTNNPFIDKPHVNIFIKCKWVVPAYSLDKNLKSPFFQVGLNGAFKYQIITKRIASSSDTRGLSIDVNFPKKDLILNKYFKVNVISMPGRDLMIHTFEHDNQVEMMLGNHNIGYRDTLIFLFQIMIQIRSILPLHVHKPMFPQLTPEDLKSLNNVNLWCYIDPVLDIYMQWNVPHSAINRIYGAVSSEFSNSNENMEKWRLKLHQVSEDSFQMDIIEPQDVKFFFWNICIFNRNSNLIPVAILRLNNDFHNAKFSYDSLIYPGCFTKDSCLQNDDSFIFLVQIVAHFDSTNVQQLAIENNKFYKGEMQMYEQLLFNTLFSDVTIIIGNHEIPAHKAILSARSRIFQHIITSTNSDVIEIADVDYNTALIMIKFIYTAEFTDYNLSNITDIIKLAKRFELEGLRQKAEQYMMKNVVIIVKSSDGLEVKNLKKIPM